MRWRRGSRCGWAREVDGGRPRSAGQAEIRRAGDDRGFAAYHLGMPVVFRYKGFRFFFYSNEGNPREALHVHVRGGGGEAKLWLDPAIRVAASDGFDARTLRELAGAVEQNRDLIERAWHEHFA